MEGQLVLTDLTNEYGQCLAAATLELGRMRVVQASLGSENTLVLDKMGEVWSAGSNEYGQLGRDCDEDEGDFSCILRRVTGLGSEPVAFIASGGGHSAALTESRQLFLWGLNHHGQRGTGVNGSLEWLPPPAAAGGELAVAAAYVAAVRAARRRALQHGAVRCPLGALLDAAESVVAVACGGSHTVAVTTAGRVIAFGGNIHGELGMPGCGSTTTMDPTPVLLACVALDGVRIVGCAAGGNHTCLVSDDGRVFAMGRNGSGQLGLGHTTDTHTPTEIDAAHFGGAPIAAVACGGLHTMAITCDEGKLYGWGDGPIDGENGATGLGHTHGATTPQPVVGALADARVVRITAGSTHSCALVEDGRVFAFGRDDDEFGTPQGALPAAGADGTPQLLQGALAGVAPVCALGAGCQASHLAFLVGVPPAQPGFDAPVSFRWSRRRALLMCLLATQPCAGDGDLVRVLALPESLQVSVFAYFKPCLWPRRRPLFAAGAPSDLDTIAPAGAAETDVLLRMAALPEVLWRGPRIFQYL
jgi:alpha-tubulin suppressor-like RCC1 family protein